MRQKRRGEVMSLRVRYESLSTYFEDVLKLDVDVSMEICAAHAYSSSLWPFVPEQDICLPACASLRNAAWNGQYSCAAETSTSRESGWYTFVLVLNSACEYTVIP